jgi:hypothetical protein
MTSTDPPLSTSNTENPAVAQAPLTPTSIMYRLPLEIVVMILEELMDYDLAPHKHSEYAEQRPNKLVLFDTHQIEHGWVKFTQTAHTSILAARLTCSMLYHASQKSFARLIGDRIFRYTKLNTEDLARIGQKSTLSSCITTLTIGTGVFYPPNKINIVANTLSVFDAPDRIRLVRAYIDHSSCQHNMLPEIQDKLVSLLRAFSNLSTIRIAADDFPENLDGWFQAGDEELMRPILDPNLLECHNGPQIIRDRFYKTGIITSNQIIAAMSTAKLALKHLFISPDHHMGVCELFGWSFHTSRSFPLHKIVIASRHSCSTCFRMRQTSRT